jgi:hypothetical protein
MLSNAAPIVRIYAPSEGFATSPKEKVGPNTKIDELAKRGLAIKAGPPWPTEIVGKDGSLPEYVISEEKDGKLHWVAAEVNRERPAFYNRARVDLEPVVERGHDHRRDRP